MEIWTRCERVVSWPEPINVCRSSIFTFQKDAKLDLTVLRLTPWRDEAVDLPAAPAVDCQARLCTPIELEKCPSCPGGHACTWTTVAIYFWQIPMVSC